MDRTARPGTEPSAGATAPAAGMPIRLYIAALGGEGGGVLTAWIVSLASGEGWPVQSTSIPGVAQRTGATTYYVEILPRRWEGPGAPVFALTPTPGFVDVAIATELLEAGRVIEHGFVSPERTIMIASSHRSYTIHEKSAMADERAPSESILKAIDALAARPIVLDLAATARESGAVVNSVAFGALAATGVLPCPREAFEAVVRGAGIAVEANLRGFAAGFDAIAGGTAGRTAREAPSAPAEAAGADVSPSRFPAEVEAVVRRGVERLTDYQDAAYAGRYRRFVERVLAAERGAGGGATATAWPVSREAARYLALWMSYEDIIRVAALKTKRERWDEIEAANRRGAGDVLRVTEFLKPGVEEMASLLPPRLGRWVVGAARRRGKLDSFNVGLHLRTTTVTGFFAMRLLARLKPWRRRSYRFREEMAALEAWLDLAVAAIAIDPAFGAEVVECARLRKGYGATHRRGTANFEAIMTRVVRPAVAAGRSEAARVAELRQLALSDPEGTTMIDALDGSSVAEGRGAAETAE